MIDWHSFLQVNLLPLRSLRGPLTIPDLSPAMIPVLQSGSSFTKDRIDKVAPTGEDTFDNLTVESLWKTKTPAAPGEQKLGHKSTLSHFAISHFHLKLITLISCNM